MENGIQEKISKNGPSLSRVIAGVMNWGVWGADLSVSDTAACIEKCIEMGVTTFDHADIYGLYSTEKTFGDAIDQMGINRSDYEIITKCGICLPGSDQFPEFTMKSYDTTKAHIIRSVENSLQHLNTNYIDVLLIHRPSPIMDPTVIAETFANLKAVGKVLHLGVSNFTPIQMDMMQSVIPDLVTNQVEASVTANAVFLDGTLDHAINHGYKPMAWSPLGGGGLFTGEAHIELRSILKTMGEKYEVGMDTMSYAFLFHHPSRIFPITGSSKPERIRKAVDALSIKLDNQDWFAIWEACQGKSVP